VTRVASIQSGLRRTAGAEEERSRTAQDHPIRDARRQPDHVPSYPRAGPGGSLTAIFAPQEHHSATSIARARRGRRGEALIRRARRDVRVYLESSAGSMP
jgi:hypothetical protein